MTRILRLLLIAAIALPLWQPMAAQEIEVIPGKKAPTLKMQRNQNLDIMNPVATQSEDENVSPDGVKLDPSIFEHKHGHAPSLKAGGDIYDYYEELLMPNSQVNTTQTYLNLPIRGAALNTRSEGQMIYNKSLLGGLQNGDIIYAIEFYAYTTITQIGEDQTNSVTVRMGNTTTSSYTQNSVGTQMTNMRSSLTSVYTGPMPTGNSYAYFEFSEPITYTGNNLVVDLVRNSGDYASTIYWYSTLNQSNSVSAYIYGNNSATRSTTLPAMRVYYKRPHTGTAETRTVVVKDESFFAGIEYSWPYNAEPQNQQTSTLDEIATDPDQMIAMIRKVYMDPTIPGNLKRGFAADGSNTGQNNQNVYYNGVCGMTIVDGATNYNSVNSYTADADDYGWGIFGTVASTGSATIRYQNGWGYSNGTVYYANMDPNQYKPNEEGLTLLLVELKDTYVDGSNDAIYADASYATQYDRLRAYFQNTVKSVRVLTEAKRMSEGLEAGTLFKIDCDKMNKFFLLAKGQLNLDHSSAQWWSRVDWINQSSSNIDFSLAPHFMHCDLLQYPNQFIDANGLPIFYHMFEQFSPVTSNATHGLDDIYQSLVNMQSFGVKHDCIGITGMNHQFLMYGDDSQDADCQDVRDMMFFIPDYRMLEFQGRGSSQQEYHNYHPDLQPTVGLYVIRQNEITPTTEADDYYMLNLNWVTNLDDFLPGEDQEFELLQVVINDSTGVEEYIPVYYMNANGEYTDANGNVVSTPVPIMLRLGSGAEKNYEYVYVARQEASQQVTYAIRGRDAEHFLSLQISNRQSFIIPGTDPQELVSLIELAHYSRYNPENEENCYSNRFKMSNNIGGLTRNNMSSAQNTQNVFTFTRKTSSTDENPVTIATATVTNRTQNGGTITIVMQNQAEETEFPKAKNSNGYAGYHANPGDGTTWTQNFTYKTVNGNDYVDFGNFVLCDNFIADVKTNAHPNQYIYEVKFNIVSTTDHNFDEAHGSAFSVPIYKTASKVNNVYSLIEVKGDKDHAIAVDDFTFSERVQYSSKTEILRYDVYRWPAGDTRYIVSTVGDNDEEQDIAPDGIAGNQGEGYTVTMNDVNGNYYYNGGTIAVSSGTAWADFVDYYPASVAESSAEGKAFVYAPVVETFTVGKNVIGETRTDYNTYGGPQQSTAVGVLDIDNPNYSISDYSWLKGSDRYAYYTVDLPIKTDEVPDGYKIYMVRAWRVVTPTLLDEPLEAFADRKTENGEYMFEEMLGPNEDGGEYQSGMSLGATAITGTQNVYRGTFGARKVLTQTGDNDGCLQGGLPMTFRVRLYFTKDNASKAGEQDKTFYVAEYTTDFTVPGGIPTGIVDVMNAKQIVSEKYYNPAGVESDTPFDGVNIVVTRYSDGSTTTTKILK